MNFFKEFGIHLVQAEKENQEAIKRIQREFDDIYENLLVENK